ncbi:hypothetical protein BDY21DRAFT_331667 [Lineolata rhizophorae]|uniref:Uncharacterized protein n=1 Tax=Lineolata rhizophorae TaxID=578093 RepID=A0A6A6PBE5_9PEZI|nr:hypothetical protein BDY21DRAFT_331667 [Lineolata rhizophorae]
MSYCSTSHKTNPTPAIIIQRSIAPRKMKNSQKNFRNYTSLLKLGPSVLCSAKLFNPLSQSPTNPNRTNKTIHDLHFCLAGPRRRNQSVRLKSDSQSSKGQDKVRKSKSQSQAQARKVLENHAKIKILTSRNCKRKWTKKSKNKASQSAR